MKLRVAFLAAVTAVLVASAAWAEPLPTAKPEQVGLSSARLERVGQSFEAQIGRGRFPGAAVLIMRKGKIAYFETFGQRDPATGAPMTKDAIFRLYCSENPVRVVRALMPRARGLRGSPDVPGGEARAV
jgi:CubicO group peptidase (beta-lactamase class C family)